MSFTHGLSCVRIQPLWETCIFKTNHFPSCDHWVLNSWCLVCKIPHWSHASTSPSIPPHQHSVKNTNLFWSPLSTKLKRENRFEPLIYLHHTMRSCKEEIRKINKERKKLSWMYGSMAHDAAKQKTGSSSLLPPLLDYKRGGRSLRGIWLDTHRPTHTHTPLHLALEHFTLPCTRSQRLGNSIPLSSICNPLLQIR